MDLSDLVKRLRTTTLLRDLPVEQLEALLTRSPMQHAPPGAWLARAGDGLKNHLVLLSGEVQARRAWTGEGGGEQQHVWRVAVDAEGAGFSLLGAAGHSIGVQAVSPVDWLPVDADALDDLLGWAQVMGKDAPAQQLRVLRRVLRKVPLENMRHAFERMQERSVAQGETVVVQGEAGEHYYVVLSGEAEVWRTDPFTDEVARVALLREGDAFGEEALLQEASRNATVKMISPGRLLVLSKADFDELLKPAMLEELDAVRAHEMLQGAGARLLDCRYEMEYEESRIPGATLIPLDQLREGVFALDPEPTYIVYCRSGRRSKAASFLLRERGIRAYSLQGGIRDWPYTVDSAPP